MDDARKERLRERAEHQAHTQSGATVIERVNHELELQNQESMRLNSELDREKQRYLQLFNDAPTGYVIVGNDTLIIQHNEAFRDMIGEKPELIGKSIADYLIPSERRSFLSSFSDLFKNPDDKHFETTLIGNNETEPVETQVSARKTTNSPNISGDEVLLLTITNITDIRRAHRLVETSHTEKDLALREVHHGIKNSFAVLASFVSMQMAGNVSAEVRNTLEETYSRILVFSSLYRNLYESEHYDDVDIGTVITMLVRQFRDLNFDNSKHEISIEATAIIASVKVAIKIVLIANEILIGTVAFQKKLNAEGDLKIKMSRMDSHDLQLLMEIKVPAEVSLETVGEVAFPDREILLRLIEEFNGTLEESTEQHVRRLRVVLMNDSIMNM